LSKATIAAFFEGRAGERGLDDRNGAVLAPRFDPSLARLSAFLRAAGAAVFALLGLRDLVMI
jgi:hypothetical protein